MDSRGKSANLGRTELWLRTIGFFIWLFVGLSRLAPTWAESPGSAPAWRLPWLVYGAAFIGAGLHRRIPRWLRVTLLALQSASVLLLPGRGLGGFEGLLLSIVAVQVPTVLPIGAALLWALAQIPFMLAVVFPFKSATEMIEIVGAYSSFSAFALLVYWLHGQESRARQALARANADLLSTRALLLAGARQSERLRISRELHDSLGHHLIAISLHLELAEQLAPGAAAGSILKAKSISQGALAEVRRVVAALQSTDGLELIPTLRALAAGIPAPRIHVQGDESLRIDDPESSHALFRCIQEAITNSLKHAGAQNIWVEVAQRADCYQACIRDDGKGVGEVVAGSGLNGIRARIAQLDGEVMFQSQPGGGFAVAASVPLARTAR